MQLLQERIDIGRESGETGCLLDGFPRTLLQAEALPSFTDVQLAVNLSLREEVREQLSCRTLVLTIREIIVRLALDVCTSSWAA